MAKMKKSKITPPSSDEMIEGRPLLIIRWNDHWARSGWAQIDECISDESMEPYFCISVGWEIGRNDRVVKLAQSLDEGTKCAEVITILLSDVISEEEITFA